MKLIPVFLLFTSFIIAQTKPYYYPVQTSLGDHRITTIVQDDFGRLILGTDKGIFTFNGFQSKQIPSSKLYSNDILQIIKLQNRFYGLNKTGQLFVVKEDRVSTIPIPQIKSPIVRLEETANGELRIICSEAIYTYSLQPFSLKSTVHIPFYEKGKAELIDYSENEKGSYALLSSNEFVDLKDQTARTLPGMTGRWLMNLKNKLVILPAKPNSNISMQFSNKRFKNLNKLIGSFNHSIQKVCTIDEHIYLLSETGLIILRAGEMKIQSVIVGMHVTAVFQDKDKNVWIGTKTKGLYCMPFGSYKLLNATEFNSLEAYNNQIIARTNGGETQFLTSFGKKSNKNPFKNTNPQENVANAEIATPIILADEFVKSILPLKAGGYLIASSKGLFKIDAKTPKEFRKKLLKPDGRTEIFANPIKDLVVSDSSSEMLFSNLEGLFTLNLETLEYHSIRYFNESIDPSQILFNNRKWYVLSSTNKIFTINKGRITHEVNFRENGTNILVTKLKIYNNKFYILSDKTLYRTDQLDGNLERLDELSRMNDLFLRDFVILDKKVFVATQLGLFLFKWEQFKSDFPSFILGKPTGDFQTKNSPKFESENTEVIIPYELVELMGNHPYDLQYRLIRNDNTEQVSWSNTSLGLTKLTFEHLSSGSYKLELRLFDPGTKSFSKLISTSFLVKASWYEDTLIWFIAGILVGFFGLLYLKRRKRLKKMELN
ncbi:two-component regulator propeller domain-containing protein [Fluviicola taffensis]|uniref:Two component regulator propeller n=1 Tax=Fluviicola taffensis (strain DSM 16823 / NCIMB 13979 / RW262) TaxID=755732 RepID=F2IID4_FLUTR|nr:two-component regulator propeller domain-containing protein [Fluviicola taffensis]AEA44860.1 Two component regulator propeller [Fluviicola taffensis DSM 16823]